MKWVYLLVGLFYSVSLFAQEDTIRNYRIDSGLNSNTIYDLLVDRHGYLWAATEKGANRFDGTNFESFTTKEGASDNDVLKLFEDSKGRIWFLGYNGKLSYYLDGKIYSKKNWPFKGNADCATFYIGADEMPNGELIFYSRNDGITILKENTFYSHLQRKFSVRKVFQKDNELRAIVSNEKKTVVYKIDSENPGNRQIEADLGLQHIEYICDQDEQNIFFLKFKRDENYSFLIYNKLDYSYSKFPLPFDRNLKINFLNLTEEEVIIGTYNGIYIWDRINWRLKERTFHSKQVSAYLQDFEGNTWISTLNEGLFQIRNSNLKRYKGISSVVNSIKYDQVNKSLWVGGIDEVRRIKNDVVTQLQISNNNLDVLEILPISDAQTLFALNGYFVFNDQAKLFKQPGNVKSMLHRPEQNDILFCLGSALVPIPFSELKNLDALKVDTAETVGMIGMIKIQDDQYYVSTNSSLYKMTGKRMEEIPEVDARIISFHKSDENDYWMASSNRGLFHLQDDQTTNYTTEDGLISNELIQFAPDAKGNLWVAADKGISYIDIHQSPIQYHNYPLASDLYRHQITDIALVADTVIIGSSGGLFYFLSANYNAQEILPKLHLEAFTVNGVGQPINDNIKLHHAQNRLQLKYSGISFTSDDLNYRYRFSQSDDWNYTNNSHIDLVNLNPGDYRLTIQAIKLNSIYSDPQEFVFTILEPFYRRAEFLLLFALLGIALFYGITHLIIRGIKRNAESNRILAESQQKALRAQMNPHFLFNALNSIQSFFLEGKNTNGQEYISKFSRLIRNTLDNSDVKAVTIDSEIQNLKMYTDLENLRMKNKFEFIVELDPGIDPYNQFIPSMLLQPIVENSIWHGINYLREKKGEIVLAFHQNGTGALHISIQDNGIGLEAAQAINQRKKHKSKGSVLLQNRVKAMNATRKQAISYSIEEREAGGTLVTIKIPNHD